MSPSDVGKELSAEMKRDRTEARAEGRGERGVGACEGLSNSPLTRWPASSNMIRCPVALAWVCITVVRCLRYRAMATVSVVAPWGRIP